MLKDNSVKWVVRLSVMFKDEDQDAFKQRVELSKQRQQNAEDEMRFLKYVDSQPDKQASVLSPGLQNGIVRKVNDVMKSKPEN